MSHDTRLVRMYKVKDHRKDFSIGDYVFVSRWSDCDPNDPWALGFIGGFPDEGRLTICEQDGSRIKGVGVRTWPYAFKVTEELGHRMIELWGNAQEPWSLENWGPQE